MRVHTFLMMNTTNPGPATWAQLDGIEARWASSGAFSEQTLMRSAETLRRFTLRLSRSGVDEWAQVSPANCAGFIHAHAAGDRPRLHTQHARRTVLRMTFRTLRELGYPVGDPTLDIVLPPKTSRAARPLDDDEVAMCRVASRLMVNGSLRHAVVWALAEATAVTSEITELTVADVDDSTNPRQIALPGTGRHDARTGALSAWGSTILRRHLARLQQGGADGSTRLAYSGRARPGGAKAQATACNAVADVLRVCRLHTEPDVRPASVRGWAGRTLLDGGAPIAEVARRLGLRSLDATAEDIAFDWRGTQ